jgi:hypothetical protein
MQKAMPTAKLIGYYGFVMFAVHVCMILTYQVTVFLDYSDESMNFLHIHYFIDVTRSPVKEITYVLVCSGQLFLELYNICFQVTYLTLCLHVDALYSDVFNQISNLFEDKLVISDLEGSEKSSDEQMKKKVYEKVFMGPSTSKFVLPLVKDKSRYKSEALEENIVKLIEACEKIKKLVADVQKTFIVIIVLGVMSDVLWLGYALTNAHNFMDILGFITTTPFFFFEIFLYCHGTVLLGRGVSIESFWINYFSDTCSISQSEKLSIMVYELAWTKQENNADRKTLLRLMQLMRPEKIKIFAWDVNYELFVKVRKYFQFDSFSFKDY